MRNSTATVETASDYRELCGEIFTAKNWKQDIVTFQGEELSVKDAEKLKASYSGPKTVYGKIPANGSFQRTQGFITSRN